MKKSNVYLLALSAALVGSTAVFSSCKKDDTTTPTVTADKTKLSAVIDSTTTIHNAGVEGTKPGYYAVGSKATFKTSIDAGTTVKNDGNATQTVVNTAVTSLRRAALAFQNARIQEVSAANLVAQWKFNGDATDATGNGNNGTLKSGPGANSVPSTATTAAVPVDGNTLPALIADRFGVANAAYSFDNGAYIEVPYKLALNPQAVTVSAWVYRTDNNANNYILSVNRWNTFKFQLQDYGKPFLTVSTTASIADRDADSGIVPVTTWTHVAASYVDGTMKFYVNGQLKKTYTDVTGAIKAAPQSVNLAIGQQLPKDIYNSNPTGGQAAGYFTFYSPAYFKGRLDDIRLYNKALSDAEVTSIYTIESTQ